MMTASTWGMNGLWRKTALVLVLCTLLLSNNVICQDDSTAVTSIQVPTAGATAAADGATVAPGVTGATAAGDAAATAGGNSAAASPQGDGSLTTPKAVDDNVVAGTVKAKEVEVNCVAKEAIPENKAVKADIAADDCEKTKQLFKDNAALWCFSEKCSLNINQEGNTVLVESPDTDMEALRGALRGDKLKRELGLTMGEAPSSSSNSTVFASVLVTGLLAALAITVGYFKCPRRSGDKAVRLAEEAYPVDQETQASTLASAAPLNPPPETEEKPTENSDSTEPAKTEPAPPPTNGHSTPKVAEVEL